MDFWKLPLKQVCFQLGLSVPEDPITPFPDKDLGHPLA